jgi:ComEC/Rec2-related protein
MSVAHLSDHAVPARSHITAIIENAPPDSIPPVGTIITARGLWRPIAPPANIGAPDRRERAWGRGDLGTILLPSTDALSTLAPTDPAQTLALRARSLWHRALAPVRAAAAASLASMAAPPAEGTAAQASAWANARASNAMIGALLLGVEDPDLWDTSQTFARLGLVHALSISGFHVMVLAGLAVLAVRLLGERGTLSSILVALLVLLYLLLVPAESPVVRSCIVVLVMLTAEALGRRYDRLNTLGWTCAVMALARPAEVLEPGFALSFTATAALLLLADALDRRLFPRPILGVQRTPATRTLLWLRTRVATLTSASMVAWLISAPLVAAHTGTISLLGIPASIIVVPLLVPVLWLGFAMLLVGTFLPIVHTILAPVLSLMGRTTLTVVNAIDHAAPWSVLLSPGVSMPLACAMTLWLIFATRAFATPAPPAPTATPTTPLTAPTTAPAPAPTTQPPPRRPSRPPVPRLLALAFIAQLVWAIAAALPDRTTAIDSLDVQGGRCTLIRDNADTLLIDAGAQGVWPARRLERDLPRLLRATGLRTVPRAVITGPRRDRWAAIPGLVHTAGLREVLIAPVVDDIARLSPGSDLADLLDALHNAGVTVRVIRERTHVPVGTLQVELTPASDGTLDPRVLPIPRATLITPPTPALPLNPDAPGVRPVAGAGALRWTP